MTAPKKHPSQDPFEVGMDFLERARKTRRPDKTVHYYSKAAVKLCMADLVGDPRARAGLHEIIDKTLNSDDENLARTGYKCLKHLVDEHREAADLYKIGQFLYGQGHPIAELHTKDIKSVGLKFIAESADKGHVPALMKRAGTTIAAIDPKRPDIGLQTKVFEDLNRAASLGSGDAALTLGTMYTQGVYLPRDVGRAKQYLETACRLGGSDAYIQTGLFYKNGDLPSHNAAAVAIRHFDIAAQKGNPYGYVHAAEVHLEQLNGRAARTKLFKAFVAAAANRDQTLMHEALELYDQGVRKNLLTPSGSEGPTRT